HDAGHRLELAVEGRGRSLGPGTAEPGDGAVDEARVEGRQRLVAEAEAVHDAAAEVLPHHVGTDHEARDDLDRLRTAQVEGEAALVAVHGQEGRGHLPLRPCLVGGGHPRLVAFVCFYLYDVHGREGRL